MAYILNTQKRIEFIKFCLQQNLTFHDDRHVASLTLKNVSSWRLLDVKLTNIYLRYVSVWCKTELKHFDVLSNYVIWN